MPGRPPPPVSLVLLGSARCLHAVAELGDTETSEEGEKHSWPSTQSCYVALITPGAAWIRG